MLKSKNNKAIIFLLILLSFTAAFPVTPSVFAADVIQVKGSDTMVNLGQAWAEEFMRTHPQASIAITGGGSGTGISALISGTCDIAQASRSMTAEEIAKANEHGKPVKELIVGLDGIAVIVHPANPISKLTLDQLSKIFTGEITNWQDLGGKDLPILILSRERNSGTHVFFLEHVLRHGNAKGPEEFSEKALMMPSNQSIVQEVKSSEAAISYVGIGYVSSDIKVLAIANSAEGEYIFPDMETVQNETYPIARGLLFYVHGDPQGIVKEYIDFVLSQEGQEILRLLDFVPLYAKS